MGGTGSGVLSNIEPKFHISRVDSSIFITGAYYGTNGLNFGGTIITQDPLLSGENGMFIAKVNRLGQLQWVKHYQGGGANFFHDIAFDDQGGVYAGGQTGDPITIEGSLIDYSGAAGYLLMKFSSLGDLQWMQHGSNGNIQELEWTGEGLVSAMVFADSVSVDGTQFIATPSSQEPAQDVLILTFDAGGQLNNYVQLQGEGNVTASALVCNDTMCVLQGKFDSELTIDGDNFNTSGPSNYKAYQYAFELQPYLTKWSNISSEPFSVLMDGLYFGSDGVLYATATYENDFEMLGYATQSQGNRDILVLRQDLNSGEILLPNSFGSVGSDAVLHVSADQDRVIISGRFGSEEVAFDGIIIENPDQIGMPYIVVLDTALKGQCALSISADTQSKVFQTEMLGDTLYSLVLVTSFTHIEDTSLAAFGGFDLALIKTLMPCSDIMTSEIRFPLVNGFLIYPNPANAMATLTMPVAGTYNIMVMDAMGRVVYQGLTAATSYELATANWPQGIYAITATNKEGVQYTSKLVVGR